MKLAIVGSRDFFNYEVFKNTLEDYLLKHNIKPTLIISGGASGTDKLAEDWAKEEGIKTKIFKADWNTHGKAAGPLRNSLIIEEAEGVIAFWDKNSRGTRDSINKAKAVKKLLNVFDTRSVA